MTVTWIPAAKENYDESRICDLRDGAVIHHFGWVDEPLKPRRYTTIDGAIAWFQQPRPRRPTSAHFLVSGRRVVQMVPLTSVAYHAGPANATRVGIEHDPLWSDDTYETATLLTAVIFRLAGVAPSEFTIRGHNLFSATACPGTCDIGRYIDQADRAFGGLNRGEVLRILTQIRL